MIRLVHGGSNEVGFIGMGEVSAATIMVGVAADALVLNRNSITHNVLPAEECLLAHDLAHFLDRVEVNRVLSLQLVRFLQRLQNPLRPLDFLAHLEAREEHVPHLV